jgi:DNA-binding response OmpR family regulator
MAASRILVVDDDDDIRGLVRTLLERAGHDVVDAPDGRAGLRELYGASPDLVILDVAMPVLDGWATLERIRDVSDVPVLMLTARDAEPDRRGLTGGADDYVVKPFGRQELVARVDVLLRRPRRGAEQDTYADARLSISFPQRAVRYDDREVSLTRLEYRLLSALVRHPHQVLGHDQLRELVWGDTVATSRDEVKLYVGYLRRKLDPDDPGNTPIETVRGFGYRYKRPA